MLRRILSSGLLFFFLAAVFLSSGFAQQLGKMAFINSQDILERSAEGKKVLARLQEREKKTQSDLAKLDEDIRQLETRLNTQRLTLTEEALLQLSSDLKKKQTDRQRLAEDAYRDSQELALRLFNRLQMELLPIIEQIGKEKDFDVIFDLAKSGAVYFNPVVDITDEVIKRYDASKAAGK